MSVFRAEYDVGAKRAWRCHVCNDIHFGAAPPVVCPTCGARRAFVLVDRDETLKILGERGGALTDSKSIVDAWKRFGDAGEEYKLVEDAEMVQGLAEGVLNNQRDHGLRYCPCRLVTGDFDSDLKLICPCNFQVQKTWSEKGECWCGLFVKRGVSKTSPLPAREEETPVKTIRKEEQKMSENNNRLIWFSGRECVHCKRIRPVVEQFQADTGKKITELEVWHSEENAGVMRGYGDAIKKACGGDLGVPAFFNEKTKSVVCGMVTLDKLKVWAEG